MTIVIHRGIPRHGEADMRPAEGQPPPTAPRGRTEACGGYMRPAEGQPPPSALRGQRMVGADCRKCAYNRGGTCTRGNYAYYQGMIGGRCPYFELDYTRG
ncbi:MAG: hypothetical protein AB1665_01040 [Candidatus Thermoplasmatota archaeon]